MTRDELLTAWAMITRLLRADHTDGPDTRIEDDYKTLLSPYVDDPEAMGRVGGALLAITAQVIRTWSATWTATVDDLTVALVRGTLSMFVADTAPIFDSLADTIAGSVAANLATIRDRMTVDGITRDLTATFAALPDGDLGPIT